MVKLMSKDQEIVGLSPARYSAFSVFFLPLSLSHNRVPSQGTRGSTTQRFFLKLFLAVQPDLNVHRISKNLINAV